MRDRLIGERARLLLDQQRPVDAAKLLSDYRDSKPTLPGELHFLTVESLLELWRIAIEKQQQQLANGLLSQATAVSDQATREQPGYWAVRCTMSLEFARESQELGADLAGAIRRARSLFLAGRVDESVASYGEAVLAARTAGKDDVALELGYQRASIQFQSKQYEQSAVSFAELVEHFPTHPRSASAHLLRAYSLGKLFEQQPTPAREAGYRDSLIAHRTQFAADATAVEATWMLANLEEQRQQFTSAVTLYESVPADHRRGPDSAAALARCCEQIIEQARRRDESSAEWETAAIEKLGRIAAAFPPEVKPISHQQADVALRLARILLQRKQPDFVQADRLLERILITPVSGAVRESADQAASSTAWQRITPAAQQLRLISLAGQGRRAEAQRVLASLSKQTPAETLAVLDGLMQLAQRVDESVRRDLGEIQLQAARSLEPQRASFNTVQQTRLDECLARAYSATGQPRSAIEIYERLLSRSPNDKTHLKNVASLMITVGTPEALFKARTNWRKLESLSKAGSPEWLEARYQVCRCCFDLKEYSECRKLLTLTRLLYPQIDDAALRERFDRLESDLKQSGVTS
jgi:tetratricopeptide (TPR) repeat protein